MADDDIVGIADSRVVPSQVSRVGVDYCPDEMCRLLKNAKTLSVELAKQ